MIGLSTRKYPAVGRCIYCAATEFSAGTGEPPHDEHIIPLGLCGDMVLPQASCEKCAKKINIFEQGLMRGPWEPFRRKIRVPSRGKKRKSEFRLYVSDRDWVSIDAADAPAELFMHVLSPLNISSPSEVVGNVHFRHPDNNYRRLWEKYGIEAGSPGPHNLWYVCRLLAKIAHCLAVCAVGLDNFEPVLVKHILNDANLGPDKGLPDLLKFVGGTNFQYDKIGQLTYEVYLSECDELDGKGVPLIATIRLFGDLGMPAYDVLAGFAK